MTSTIQRRDFTTALSANGGYVNIDHLPSDVATTLSDAGITAADLQEIAGQDHVIRGQAEFQRLFDRIDQRVDRDGRSGQLTTRDAGDRPTSSGRVFDALRAHVDANRARADREGGARFTGDAVLSDVAAGRRVLRQGDSGPHVQRLQQALLDMGYAIPTNGASGTYDAETARAVSRFQRDAGLSVDGGVGAETLGAIRASAPPPGQQVERFADYDRMRADGRLDVTLAIGYDEDGGHRDAERQVLSGLRARGFSPLTADQIRAMPAAERQRLGLADDRFDPNARYFVKDDGRGGSTDTVVRLISPTGDGGRDRASFQRAMQQDEVVMYAGHARYGTGPDFDDINSGRGNFVVDGHGNRAHEHPPAGLRRSIGGEGRSDLRALSSRPDYQLLIFNSCSSEEYLHNLRNPGVSGRSMVDTDVIATTMPTLVATGGAHTLRFLDGVMGGESNNSMLGAQNQLEVDQLRAFRMTADIPAARGTYTESGFLNNDGNRRIPAASGPTP